ncbi:methylated-DNA--[protein]-cysteine S-methyltransferase [Paraliobacillus quinghaiensis]|uniref:Methylated-DNA--[protein]-cysteine S-methyltransferase n=2 Tax=Paraliobacillus quinghaiensis TaxID=470815 RepID=A0A917TJN8_9BACI|nr:methylated-DNA--[protein]-cysteine S-methyltransferase [Paraliobacillus quinghaiensis]
MIDIVQKIPAGKVMTYGQIAREAGNPRAARQVARLLHSLSDKYKLPWHRVINSKGEISLSGERLESQKGLLEQEGVQFSRSNKINLTVYRHL